MTKEIFLILNLVLMFYNVGTIWAMEVDIFRSWKLLNPITFHVVQEVHWKKLPYWIFMPLGLSFVGSIVLFWYHPAKVPEWEIWLPFGIQIISHILTGFFWGPWQYKLSTDKSGGKSVYLAKILKTHWIRTTLWNICGLMFLFITIQTL